MLFDTDLRYRMVGPDVLPFSKREATDMEGKTINELFGESAGAELEPELRATLGGDSRSFDMTYDDQIHHIETRPVTIDGAPFGVLVTQEVTGERETTIELEEKTERLEMVASILSHDLRNPLNVALGHLDELQAEGTASQESLSEIRRALTRMDTIMEDAHVLARTTTLNDVERTTLRSLVESAWLTVPTEAATLDVKDELTLEADSGLMRNLFENLIRNAISHGGPTVGVHVGALDTQRGFYFEDDGSGIDVERRDVVFDSGRTSGDDKSHSGLGLNIVQEIVTAHGWHIEVTDATSGGARFEITGVTPHE
ncbi:PAS domain-containing sensor histidine kinase [Halorubellus sp. JP-L1]|nr:PAS domain-containing sensor histidine kinase [Halorubellus sp. JP-L1]